MKLGAVTAIDNAAGIVRLSVKVDGEVVEDVLAGSLLRVQLDLVVGDRVLLFNVDAGDVELVAIPFHVQQGVTPYQIRVADGNTVEVVGDGTAVELALKSDVEGVKTAYDGHSHADPVSGFVGTPVTAPAGTPRLIPAPTGTSVLKGE